MFMFMICIIIFLVNGYLFYFNNLEIGSIFKINSNSIELVNKLPNTQEIKYSAGFSSVFNFYFFNKFLGLF